MAMFILGVLVVAGEYRHRTMLTTFLAEPRRLRVIVAKLVTVGGIGAALAAATYGVTFAVAEILYARNGVSHLGVDATRLGWGTVLSGAAYGLLGVAVGALTRNRSPRSSPAWCGSRWSRSAFSRTPSRRWRSGCRPARRRV